MLHFTKYAEQKFDILNKHKVYITREDIESALEKPDITGKKPGYLFAQKDNLKVIYKVENGTIMIITFYPV